MDRWSGRELVEIAAQTLRDRDLALREEQAVSGLDALDEVGLHPLLGEGFRGRGLGVHPEQVYAGVVQDRAIRRDRERCDLVLAHDPEARLIDPVTELVEIDRASGTLFEPVADELAGLQHLVFEPDGAMLRLPVDILVADDASVEAYVARVDVGGGDPFDFRGTNWLGRNTRVSTAVSAQAFIDARRAASSAAKQEYLGLGSNQPIGDEPPARIEATLVGGGNECGWSVAEWNRPIDDAELRSARAVIGESASQLITGGAFTDLAIKQKPDLDQFRVVHFATHGLVTPPRPGCPARPALLTSFADAESDGLLSFEEIFDLELDADIVILSACDTAGQASIEATRAAGVGSGGGTALDGLVRAFIGAGGRTILASHWPAPEDYEATRRLMDGMFERGRNSDVGQALRDSQRVLMDEAVTSHPYYWAGFAIIGDASRPLLSGLAQAPVADGVQAGQ